MFQNLKNSWIEIMSSLPVSEWQKRLAIGDIGLEHYKGFLLETYHQAGTNPQIQSYATMFFDGNPREIVKMFYKHAISEIGHDILAMNDLMNLGISRDLIVNSKPLPITKALSASVLHDIQFKNPVRYLGYLFHLEFLPTQNGPKYLEQLSGMGVPKNAVTFLEEHATVDVGHNKLMEIYVNELVTSTATFNEVVDTMYSTAYLHQKMLDDSFANGEKIFK
ncbi:MAG: iron-containing redox enzyme family protein [Pseudobdellovibrio sp.]